MSTNISYLNSALFDEVVLKSDIPVIVDFFSDECPPCDVLAPIYEKLAEKYDGHIKFVKIFRQENRELAASLHVTGSPTVLFFKDGAEVGTRLSGYLSKAQVRLAIENVLGDVLPQTAMRRVDCQLLILGAGPAGLSAAIYAARAKVQTVVLDVSVPGGQAASTYHIENYPGTAGAVCGKALTENMRRQAEQFGAVVDDLKEIFEVRLTEKIKVVRTEDTEYFAGAVIIASGAAPRALPAENAESFVGKGVHYCATCDGSMYQDRKIVVVGGGDSAVEEALYLTKFASHVTLIHRSQFRAAKSLLDKLTSHDKIDVILDTKIRKVVGKDYALTHVVLENVKTGAVTELPTEGAFVYIGSEPATQLYRGQLATDDAGYIIAGEDTKTTVPGVFAAGDIRTKLIRQVVTAAADGAVSGIMAERYLSETQSRLTGANIG
ncbi:FAD-dependent oxidoreductase [Oscillospiraceae bacterium WX1]